MKHVYPKITKKNGRYGPTTQNHYYQPANYHNRIAEKNHHKSKWILKENEQYEVFRVADENKWFVERSGNKNIKKSDKGLCSMLERGNEVFGENGEVLAFFPVPRNEIDSWHGYPIASHYVKDTIFDFWFNTNQIDMITYKWLLRNRI